MLAIKRRPNQLASELLSYRRQSTWQWQTLNTGRKSARYIRRAVMQYQSKYPYDTVNVRYMDDGEASIVIKRSTQMDQLIKPEELLSGDYYWKGVMKVLGEFNAQVTANAARARYIDIEIWCDDLLANEVTNQLYKGGWLSTTHEYGNDIVKVTVHIHRSMLKQRWGH
jgi:Arc/MetJ family transcription regulator